MRNPLCASSASAVVAACAFASLWAGPCAASTLLSSVTATYYAVSPTDADFQDPGGGPFPVVAIGSLLGPNGLPVAVPGSGVNDLNGAGEIIWWSPAFNANVAQTGTTTEALPYASVNLYSPAPVAQSVYDAGALLTARLTGSFTLAADQKITLNIDVDDELLLYVDGRLQAQYRGSGAIVPVLSQDTLAAGAHTVDAFYADRHRGGAVLRFDILGTPAAPTPAAAAGGIFMLSLIVAARHRSAAT